MILFMDQCFSECFFLEGVICSNAIECQNQRCKLSSKTWTHTLTLVFQTTIKLILNFFPTKPNTFQFHCLLYDRFCVGPISNAETRGGGISLEKLWCCVNGGNNKTIWFYELSWWCKLVTVKILWWRQNFSLRYQYIIKQIGDENKKI